MTKLTVNDIRVELTTTPKEKTPDDKLGFGSVFTDHMFVMDWSSDKGWYDPRIVPYGPIPVSPALNVLHYGQSVFEGMKAYNANGEAVLFRPEQNFKRLNKSSNRIALPELDEEFALAALKKLISIDKEWIPKSEGTSLYVRPFLYGAEEALGVHPGDLEKALEENKDAKAILINYPNNPSGVSYTREEVKEIADVLGKYDIFVLSDEIYGDITYNYKHTSLAEFIPEQTVLISGLSKSHAMTGWRVGFIAAPQAMIRKIGVFHLFTVSGAPTFIQDAAVVALTDENVDKYNNHMIETYRERKDYMVPRLRELGFEIPEIDGAFYIFARIPAEYRELGAMEFCKLLAKEARVGVIPGTAFGKAYNDFFRISYATSMENIKEAVERISQFMNK